MAIFIILALFFGAVYLFVALKAKPLIAKEIQKAIHKEALIGSVTFSPPFVLRINKLEIKGLLKADSISISPSILGFLTGNIILNNIRILKPEFTYERALPQAPGAPSLPAQTTEPGKAALPRIIFKNMDIIEGKVNFIDRTFAQDGIKITIENINFNLNNLYLFPFSVVANFKLKGEIPWSQDKEKGKISAEGWFNLFKKDMQAALKIEEIDGVYLYPYYSNWVDLKKARIEKAKLNFTSNIHGLNNDVTAECRLELADIVRRPLPEGESEEKAAKIADAVLDIFRVLNQGKIVLDFTIRTKMNRPEFGFGDIKTAFEDKLVSGRKSERVSVESVLALPVKILEGTVKGATDISKAVIGGTFAVGNEFKKAVEGAFGRETKQEEPKLEKKEK